MESDEKQAKHLEFVQGVINRLASNSFSYKGWAVVTVSALAALAISKDNDPRYFLAASVSVLCFWGLDGFYLREERLFRKLYDAVRKGEVEEYSMDRKPFETKVKSWLCTCWSRTIWPLYFPVFFLILGAALMEFYLKSQGGG